MSVPASTSNDLSIKPFIGVWVAVVAVNLVELFAATKVNNTIALFGILMFLALVAAALVMAFFMHLRYERRTLVLTLIPALIFVLVMTMEMFPDSKRSHNMHPQFQPMGDQPAPQQPQH
jgi:cytochrome c oxidase subunit IV